MSQRFVATIEARMASSRLPGKMLLQAGGRPMLHHLLKRLRSVSSIDAIVIATTVNAADDPLADFAAAEHAQVFRGSEDDVMARVIGAARSAAADVIVEITGDCPLIDPDIVEQTIRMFKANDGAAYVSNSHVRSYPDGMDTQVFSVASLERSASLTDDPLDREHVSLHMRNHPELFPRVSLVAPPSVHWPELGLTLDEPADFDVLKRIIEHFGEARPLFSCYDVVSLLRERPEWIEINRSVVRKGDA